MNAQAEYDIIMYYCKNETLLSQGTLGLSLLFSDKVFDEFKFLVAFWFFKGPYTVLLYKQNPSDRLHTAVSENDVKNLSHIIPKTLKMVFNDSLLRVKRWV